MSDQTTNPAPNSAWVSFITPFATAIGKDVDAVTTALKPLVGDPTDETAELLGSDEFTSFEDIKGAFGDVPLAKLKKAVADHLRKKAAPAPAAAAAATANVSASFDALPPVPDDGTWLNLLKAGGELKVDQATIVSAIRAALAARVGLYELPDLLVTRMEGHSEELEEPVGGDFYRLRNLLTRRSYAEIFAALEGVEGNFVTQAKKNQLLGRLETNLWPALFGFHSQLVAWSDSWSKGSANPAIMIHAFAALAGGGGAPLPPGVMAPPATDTLRDAAESVIRQINKVFAGTGIPIARALAYDAHKIKEVLENPGLPAQVGAANREQMLKMLGVNVSADYVRLERNVTRFALSILELEKVTAGNEELVYLSSLVMLGSQIPWDKLSTPPRRSPSGMRGTTRE